jgi:hypothetical protein
VAPRSSPCAVGGTVAPSADPPAVMTVDRQQGTVPVSAAGAVSAEVPTSALTMEEPVVVDRRSLSAEHFLGELG